MAQGGDASGPVLHGTDDPMAFEPGLAQLRSLVYAVFAGEGRPPSVGECARLLDRQPEAILDDLRRLHQRHALVLIRDGDAIRMAHPFSAAPMGFVVSDGDRRWWGGCTWDSLGIAAALDRTLEIETLCPACGASLRFSAGPTQAPEVELAVRIPLPAAHWWDDVVATCMRIRTFCSSEHAQSWVSDSEPFGELVPLSTMWRLANVWYGDRLADDYRQRRHQDSQALLDGVGLMGDFWRLP